MATGGHSNRPSAKTTATTEVTSYWSEDEDNQEEATEELVQQLDSLHSLNIPQSRTFSATPSTLTPTSTPSISKRPSTSALRPEESNKRSKPSKPETLVSVVGRVANAIEGVGKSPAFHVAEVIAQEYSQRSYRWRARANFLITVDSSEMLLFLASGRENRDEQLETIMGVDFTDL
jgi:hypothetical protein